LALLPAGDRFVATETKAKPSLAPGALEGLRAIRDLPRLKRPVVVYEGGCAKGGAAELRDSAVLDSIPSDLRHAVTVEGEQIGEALQCLPNIVLA